MARCEMDFHLRSSLSISHLTILTILSLPLPTPVGVPFSRVSHLAHGDQRSQPASRSLLNPNQTDRNSFDSPPSNSQVDQAMDADSWSARLSSASKRYQSALQSRSGYMFLGFEEIDGDEDIREEYPCPFCSEYFDIVGLCCHIDDEHPVEAKNGVCPVCAMRVGVDMVAHITLQHGNIFKMQRKRKSRKGGSHSTLSLLRRELREGNLQSLFGGSSFIVSSNNAAPDPLLSSFILPMADDFGSVQLHSSETASVKKSTNENVPERTVQSAPLSVKDKKEKASRSEFVQGLLLSTILDGIS